MGVGTGYAKSCWNYFALMYDLGRTQRMITGCDSIAGLCSSWQTNWCHWFSWLLSLTFDSQCPFITHAFVAFVPFYRQPKQSLFHKECPWYSLQAWLTGLSARTWRINGRRHLNGIHLAKQLLIWNLTAMTLSNLSAHIFKSGQQIFYKILLVKNLLQYNQTYWRKSVLCRLENKMWPYC